MIEAKPAAWRSSDPNELKLFIEELCCELFRFGTAEEAGVLQSSKGVHTGVALGDLQVVPLRPLSRTKVGIIADSINVAARLMAAAGPGDITLSNAFYTRLPAAARAGIEELAPFEGRNVGALKAWRIPSGAR